tara:strand:- start:1491 stop:1772 length:282 start_codon:yes stop_codon:yes gene_type:complete
MSKLTKKERHQVKSRWYYLFWGAATVSVFAGQMYVGSGYRQMSRAFNRLLDETIEILTPDYYLVPTKPNGPKRTPDTYYEHDGNEIILLDGVY